jgi:hypothetical protein
VASSLTTEASPSSSSAVCSCGGQQRTLYFMQATLRTVITPGHNSAGV